MARADVTALSPDSAAGAVLPRQPSEMHKRIGIALIVVSCVLYVALVAVPLMPLDTDNQVILATGLAVSSEGTFWLGCLVAGRSILGYLRDKLWPARWRTSAAAAPARTGAIANTSTTTS